MFALLLLRGSAYIMTRPGGGRGGLPALILLVDASSGSGRLLHGRNASLTADQTLTDEGHLPLDQTWLEGSGQRRAGGLSGWAGAIFSAWMIVPPCFGVSMIDPAHHRRDGGLLRDARPVSGQMETMVAGRWLAGRIRPASLIAVSMFIFAADIMRGANPPTASRHGDGLSATSKEVSRIFHAGGLHDVRRRLGLDAGHRCCRWAVRFRPRMLKAGYKDNFVHPSC